MGGEWSELYSGEKGEGRGGVIEYCRSGGERGD